MKSDKNYLKYKNKILSQNSEAKSCRCDGLSYTIQKYVKQKMYTIDKNTVANTDIMKYYDKANSIKCRKYSNKYNNEKSNSRGIKQRNLFKEYFSTSNHSKGFSYNFDNFNNSESKSNLRKQLLGNNNNNLKEEYIKNLEKENILLKSDLKDCKERINKLEEEVNLLIKSNTNYNKKQLGKNLYIDSNTLNELTEPEQEISPLPIQLYEYQMGSSKKYNQFLNNIQKDNEYFNNYSNLKNSYINMDLNKDRFKNEFYDINELNENLSINSLTLTSKNSNL